MKERGEWLVRTGDYLAIYTCVCVCRYPTNFYFTLQWWNLFIIVDRFRHFTSPIHWSESITLPPTPLWTPSTLHFSLDPRGKEVRGMGLYLVMRTGLKPQSHINRDVWLSTRVCEYPSDQNYHIGLCRITFTTFP